MKTTSFCRPLLGFIRKRLQSYTSIALSLKTSPIRIPPLAIKFKHQAISRFLCFDYNFINNEKIFYPPKKLNTTETPPADARAGTLSYDAPWGDVVIFYKDFGSATGLYELGQVIAGSVYTMDVRYASH